MMVRGALASVVLVLVLAAAPAAHADQTIVGFTNHTFTVRSPDTPGGPDNRITVSQDGSSQLHVVDGGINLTMVAESPCFLVAVREAACPGDPSHTATLSVTTGAGSDAVVIDLPDKPSSGVAHVDVFGGVGSDTILGGGGDDTLDGGGRDGSGGPLTQERDISPDFLVGNAGNDSLRGQGGTDYLNGAGLTTTETTPNTLDGGPGSDFLDAGNSLGPDHFIGGTGEDTPSVTAIQSSPFFPGVDLPNFVIPDRSGGDVVSYETRTFPQAGTVGVIANLNGGADNGAPGEGDQIDADVESLHGTIRDDTLTGSAGDNVLKGGLGSDALSGGGGSDGLRLRDGVADHCYSIGTGDFVLADLADPTPDACRARIRLPFTFAFNAQPIDETIPFVAIGPTLRRSHGSRFVAVVKCRREAKHSCSGTLALLPARGGKTLAQRHFHAAPGRSARVALDVGAANARKLHQAGLARLRSVSKGMSRRGPTTTIVSRKV